MLFVIAQIKSFGTLNTTQKHCSPLQSTVHEKIKKNGKKLSVFNKKCIFDYFRQFFLIFSRTVLSRGLRFFALRSVSKNAYFELSKTTFGNIFKFFTIRGVPYGQKVTRRRKMVLIFFFFYLKNCTKWNKKMGGRSFVITCGVIGTL